MNEIFIAIVISWVVCSLIKFFITKEKLSFFEAFMVTGGMPSSHSSIVSSLTTTIYFLEGFSNLFFVSLVFSGLVIRDSFGVRKSVGEQAALLNKIAKHDHVPGKVKIVMGHTLFQVIAGILLGVIIGVIVGYKL